MADESKRKVVSSKFSRTKPKTDFIYKIKRKVVNEFGVIAAKVMMGDVDA